MPNLFNRNYSPLELKQYTGDLSSLAGVRLVEYQEGKARGLRVAQVWTGSGFRFEILLDRGMDIGAAEHSGRALAWTYPALATPPYHDPYKYAWARTWGGGLVTTCGLDFLDSPKMTMDKNWACTGASHTPLPKMCV